MKLWVDPRFLQERERFSFRACCEDCVHFDGTAQRCSLEYPHQPHTTATHGALREGDGVLFCKTFEVA